MEKKVLEKVKRKEKGRKLINFYSFQMRETKMERKIQWNSMFFFLFVFLNSILNIFLIDLADLRKKFEEDKKRIAAMKASRKFKPY